MDSLMYLVAGLFLPLFPLSMGFNIVLGRTRPVLLRILLLMLWPHAALLMLSGLDTPVPAWIVPLAIISSGLYALRALALRDIGQWTGFMATSAWALLWIPLQDETPYMMLHLYALGLSIPLSLLALLGSSLEQRFGAAYTGLYGGLAQSLPRLSTILVFIVLAIIATPLFPGFFIMLATLVHAFASMPAVALALVLVWLLWSWAGARLLQGLISGSAGEYEVMDLNRTVCWSYGAILLLLIAAGIYGIGALL